MENIPNWLYLGDQAAWHHDRISNTVTLSWHCAPLLLPSPRLSSNNYQLVACWSFTSLYHLRSYQNGYWLEMVHSQLYYAASLWDQAAGTITRYPTQWHYPDIMLTSPCPILLMPSARLDSDKYQFYKSLSQLGWYSNSRHCTQEDRAPQNRC